MDRSAFLRDVGALTLGKRLPDGVYVHVETLPHLPGELRAAVETARTLANLDARAFHVVKLGFVVNVVEDVSKGKALDDTGDGWQLQGAGTLTTK